MFCLEVPTDPAWAKEALRSLDDVLVDHAHCELKAASNATSLLGRYPSHPRVVRALSQIAREELEHFERVVTFLERRNVRLIPPETDFYAKDLRAAALRLPGSGQYALSDRLLIGALIEARSCERFKLLLDAMPEDEDAELRAFYRELFECEARHYRIYVDLAVEIAGSRALVETRLSLLARAEGEIVRRLSTLDNRRTVHG